MGWKHPECCEVQETFSKAVLNFCQIRPRQRSSLQEMGLPSSPNQPWKSGPTTKSSWLIISCHLGCVRYRLMGPQRGVQRGLLGLQASRVSALSHMAISWTCSQKAQVCTHSCKTMGNSHHLTGDQALSLLSETPVILQVYLFLLFHQHLSDKLQDLPPTPPAPAQVHSLQ